MNHQIVHKEEESGGDSNMDSNQQHYAHTYECLDNIDVPSKSSRVNNIHLGVNGRASARNYRQPTQNHSFGNSDSVNTTNLTDCAHFNVSSSSTSSSSGVSSTHQLIHTMKPNSNNNSTLKSHMPVTFLLNSTNQSTGSGIGNGNANSNAKNGGGQPNAGKFLQLNNGDLVNVSNIGGGAGGTWSPDSAYYSAIPALTSYTNFNLQLQQEQSQPQLFHQFTNQQLQQFVNSSFLNTHAVVVAPNNGGDGYNSHLV